MERRLARLTAAAAAFLVAGTLVACGGGGGGGVDPTAQAPGATTAGGGPGTGDQAVVARANLVISDFPTEWKSTPLPADAAAINAQNDRDFADCMGRPRPEEIRTATADSLDFSAADTRRASSSVQTVKTVDIAKDDFVALRSDRGSSCLKTQMDKEFARQLPVSGAQTKTVIEKVDLPQFGDETVAYRVTATGVVDAQQVITVIDLVFVRKDRAQLSGAFINRTLPFPQDLEKTLLQRMVGRA